MHCLRRCLTLPFGPYLKLHLRKCVQNTLVTVHFLYHFFLQKWFYFSPFDPKSETSFLRYLEPVLSEKNPDFSEHAKLAKSDIILKKTCPKPSSRTRVFLITGSMQNEKMKKNMEFWGKLPNIMADLIRFACLEKSVKHFSESTGSKYLKIRFYFFGSNELK